MKKLLVAIGLLLALCPCFAQTGPLLRPIEDLEFAHFERNRLIFPGDSLAMERFFTKMDSVIFLGEGNVSIMHIGGSHVQAGVFTQQFRDNLLSIGTDLIGGQNFVFPFSAGGTNNPSHFRVSSTGFWSYCRNAVRKETDKRMGLAGAAITTTDSIASVSIISRERRITELSPRFEFNKVTVIGYSETENVVPVVGFQGDTLKGRYDEYLSTYTFQLPTYTDSICIFFESMPGEFTLTGVLLENGMPGISVHGLGVNGARVSSYLRCDDFERDLNLIRPDLIIFGIGINDAADKDFEVKYFKRNYNKLIEIIQRVNPGCAILFVTNNDSYTKEKGRRKKVTYKVNPNGRIVEEAFMELGKQHNAAVWDQFDIMGGLGSMQDWETAELAQKDKVHFTSSGYRVIGDLLYNALISRYIDHVKANAKQQMK
jgi:lysophospholipase L1-like esterase